MITTKDTSTAYVGSTNNLNQREKHHDWDLRNNNHYNKTLQSIYIENNGELEFIGLETETIEEAQELEQTLLDAFISSGLLANVSSKAKGLDHSLSNPDHVREQNRQRMLGNKLTQGRHHDEETKRKIGNANKGNQYCLGRILSEESRKKISEAQKGMVHRPPGWHHTEEAKQKMSEVATGRIFTDEHKQKLSEAAKNRPVDLDRIEKMRQGNIGKKLSEENKRKLLEKTQHPVEVEGVVYPSIAEAARNSDLSPKGLAKRLDSPNFPEYKRLVK